MRGAMKVRVHSKTDTFSFACGEGERILYAGLAAGLQLPYECATGTCGTCRARVQDPDTVRDLWLDAPGAAKLRRDRGDVLMCQAVALKDCEMKIPSEFGFAADGAAFPEPQGGRVGAPRSLTHDVMAFDLELDRPMSFEAGQFVVLAFPGIEGFRAYSMVNYERDATRLSFVIKKKSTGGVSEWLFAAAIEGTRVEVFGPLGSAVFRPEEDHNLLCIAGGSGIAGIMSILTRACGEGYFDDHTGAVFFGVRTMADIFYRDELTAFAAQYPETLSITLALSDEAVPAGELPGGGALAFATGFVHEVAMEGLSGPYDNHLAYVAGPPVMVDGAKRMLMAHAGLPATQIRFDKFS